MLILSVRGVPQKHLHNQNVTTKFQNLKLKKIFSFSRRFNYYCHHTYK